MTHHKLSEKGLLGIRIEDFVSPILVLQECRGGQDIMAIVCKDEYDEPRVIDLGGPDGNAYALLGIATGALRQLNRDPDMFIKIMTAGDYKHLVTTFNELLGDYYTLVLPEGVSSLEDL